MLHSAALDRELVLGAVAAAALVRCGILDPLAFHAAQVSLNSLYGLGADAESRYPEQVAAVDRETLRRVAQRVIALDAYTEAVIRPQ